ncbi:hypothetical protein H5410_026323 [Solanum commersonii]|uniref:Uncharacterized protein n=1 Tax=Solanum commersonii TaxID=4109 RepID=A0A9J5YYM6_SOLCO|nr:hypothetical protein H5410_026323 [Solanum commersonii]
MEKYNQLNEREELEELMTLLERTFNRHSTGGKRRAIGLLHGTGGDSSIGETTPADGLKLYFKRLPTSLLQVDDSSMLNSHPSSPGRSDSDIIESFVEHQISESPQKINNVKIKDQKLINKSQDGLGIRNSKIQNNCLLMKWLWRFHEEESTLWREVIQHKYGRSSPWYSNEVKTTYEVGVWRSIRALWTSSTIGLFS